ncbi:hypothetical protein ACLKA6_013438 [Drosophila palustris]
MERKEVDTQQFIDHTLLASELMQNNFMMDLIDHSGVFPKAQGPTNLSTPSTNANGAVVGFVPKPTLTAEQNFHNSFFQFVNKHVVDDEPNATRSNAVPGASPERTRINYAKESDDEFLTLNSSFLNAAAAAEAGNDVEPQQGSQPAFPALAIEPTVPIDVSTALQDDELLYTHLSTTNSRKVLPHKKRISRKLKGNLASMETDLEQHKHHVQVPAVATYSSTWMQPQQQQQQQQKEPLDMCGMSAQDKLQQEQAKLDQVFHDVQLNFDNFHNISHVDDDVVDDVGVNMVIHADAISLHKNDDKLTPVGSSNATTPNEVPVVDDVEFSDTEDMLEGIRNVVDKVSIEDTCDELVDLELTTSGMRAPWFNNNYPDIAFSGLLLPGEPPPASTPLLKTNQIEAEQMTLNFLNTNKQDKEQTQQTSSLSMCHKKNYIEAAATMAAATEHNNENNEQASLVPQPSRTPTPSAGSAIEQLQRSPLMISDSFKMEDVEGTAPTESTTSSRAASVTFDNVPDNEVLCMETAKKPSSEDGSDSKRKFRCEECARDFNSHNARKYHLYTHTQERTFHCVNCDRSFYNQSALRAHARTHSDLKPFKCEHCDHKCRQWGDLKYHVISKHSDIKAHMCEFCGKSFSRKYSLVVHRRIHTSEKNYVCQYCEKSFRASSYLLSHIKVHTGEKPYSCNICDKKFRVSSDLRRHFRIHERAGVRQTDENSISALKKSGQNHNNIVRSSKLKQIEDDDDDDVTINNKSDAVCGDNDQEILGL